ncbi:MAG: glutamate synthase subunit beta [Deltaproteobacteria bacterium]|nr:glutamate synthase subunit beta [Deltaproteobacteria bacterium]MDH4122070.1 glutamate synthase subunit beta [Deltaproteobacteria bacterium]
MGKPTGFLEFERQIPPNRPVAERVKHYHEFEIAWPEENLQVQGARCMDCGVPTCHQGCPLGNLIPDWNDLVYRGQWRQALDELHRTNNFPEVTGRVCPAPCETSCVLGINADPVAIKVIEKAIIERGWKEEWVKPVLPPTQTWKRVAVVGSGPAGLAAAQELARMGHQVTVFEKDDRPGGLLTYGIPDFKLEKHLIFRRVEQLREEGVVFQMNCQVGKDLPAKELLSGFDAVLLAGGAQTPRGLEGVEGSGLKGVHFAMEFLSQQNRRIQGDTLDPDTALLATKKHVVVIGGGDTGADCVGTSHRQGAAQVTQLEILPKPPSPKVSTSHEEGGERMWSVLTKRFSADAQGRVKELHGVKVAWEPANNGGRPTMVELKGTEFTLKADLVLLAMGFTGPVKEGLLTQLGVAFSERGTVKHDAAHRTSVDKVFVAGDMGRGQSLVVWAIWEGRQAARSIHRFLMGRG